MHARYEPLSNDVDDEETDAGAEIIVIDNHMWIFGPICLATGLSFHTKIHGMCKDHYTIY